MYIKDGEVTRKKPAVPEIREPIELAPWLTCPVCGRIIAISDQAFAAYFNRVAVVCASGCKIDWWDAVHKAVRDHFMLIGAYQVIGARTTTFTSPLTRGKATAVDFCKEGVPPSASILTVNYTGLGELMPLLATGNTVRPTPLPTKVHLWTAPLGGSRKHRGQTAVAATWIDPDEGDISTSYLAQAVHAYDIGRYIGVPIPANISVESALGPALMDLVAQYCDGGAQTALRRAERFLSDGATYSYQLHPLLQLVCELLGVAPLPKEIRKKLDALREYRNDLVHCGRVRENRKPLTKERTAEVLTAAIFGFHFAQFLHEKVREKQRERDAV